MLAAGQLSPIEVVITLAPAGAARPGGVVLVARLSTRLVSMVMIDVAYGTAGPIRGPGTSRPRLK